MEFHRMTAKSRSFLFFYLTAEASDALDSRGLWQKRNTEHSSDVYGSLSAFRREWVTAVSSFPATPASVGFFKKWNVTKSVLEEMVVSSKCCWLWWWDDSTGTRGCYNPNEERSEIHGAIYYDYYLYLLFQSSKADPTCKHTKNALKYFL